MAKLTLKFKGKELLTLPIEAKRFKIGRDPENDLSVDSLAVAPYHATLSPLGEDYIVRAVDPDYPLTVNGEEVFEQRLAEGDCIGVGKHEIYFTRNAMGRGKGAHVAHEPGHDAGMGEASLQVLKGKNIGLVIPLRKAMTRIGNEEQGSAVIAHRKEGYFLSALVTVHELEVNNIPIKDESVLLNHGDVVKVGRNVLQFFHVAGGHPASSKASPAPHEGISPG
ncbi:MAG: FHA domain-containing protein [Methylococcaceae bacterium]|nr:FHA domain-containing protein [Methylococcaceae bacterium]